MDNTELSIAALGELLVDFTPIPSGVSQAAGYAHPCFEQNPGGAPANVLACFAKLGGSASFMGAVGKDGFGDFLEKTLSSLAIDTQFLMCKEQCGTTLAFVHLDNTGNRSFSFYRDPGADTLICTDDILGFRFENNTIFHFGSLSLTAEPARSATFTAIEKASAAGCIVSFDPNWRPALWKDKTEAVRLIREGLKRAELLKVSEEEAELLTGIADPERAAAELLARYGAENESGEEHAGGRLRFVAVTLGRDGCCWAHQTGTGKMPTFDIRAVDTTGAGDAFWGAFLFRFASKRKSAAALTAEDLYDACRFANAAGSLCASRRGAIAAMPTLEEIETLIKRKHE